MSHPNAPLDHYVPITIEVDARTVERIFGAAASVDPAPSLAGFLERTVVNGLTDALESRPDRWGVPAPKVRVVFTTTDGRRLRFEDGKGAEELPPTTASRGVCPSCQEIAHDPDCPLVDDGRPVAGSHP